MANPLLHIKDSYFFEVPRVLWQRHWQSKEEIPESMQFLVQAHPEATVEDFNRQLSGKILIPQPFATLKNLYEVESGFGISKFMILEAVAAVLLIAIFSRVARLAATGQPPRGKFWNLFEALLLFIRDQVARPAIDGGHHEEHDDHAEPGHAGGDGHGHGRGHGHGAHRGHAPAKPKRLSDRYLPFLWTLFFFVLSLNLLGMLPFLGAPTASFSVTLTLAVLVLLVTVAGGAVVLGPVGFWSNMVPKLDVPWFLVPLKIVLQIMIFGIEVMGLFIKHGVLGIRLLANIVAGHLVLVSILMIITTAGEVSSTGSWATAAVLCTVGSALLSIIELFVAFLQAYIITFLASLFIGMGAHEHG